MIIFSTISSRLQIIEHIFYAHWHFFQFFDRNHHFLFFPRFNVRKASLMLNNQSITPVENNTEEKHCSIVKESSQEHGHEISSTATTTAAVPKKLPEPLTKLSINNLPKSQVLGEDAIKVTDNGVGSSAKVNTFTKVPFKLYFTHFLSSCCRA